MRHATYTRIPRQNGYDRQDRRGTAHHGDHSQVQRHVLAVHHGDCGVSSFEVGQHAALVDVVLKDAVHGRAVAEEGNQVGLGLRDKVLERLLTCMHARTHQTVIDASCHGCPCHPVLGLCTWYALADLTLARSMTHSSFQIGSHA